MFRSFKVVALLAIAFSHAFASVYAGYTLEMKRDSGSMKHNPDNHKALMDSIVAKYTKNAMNYHRNTGKHARSVNASKLMKRSGNTASLDMLRWNWNVELEFGSNRQKLYVKFDTGSSDVVMDGRGYDPSVSSTSEDQHTTFNANYVSANAGGKVYKDVVAMAGIQAKDVTISVSNDDFLTMNKDAGIVGLSWPLLSSYNSSEPTFYEAFQRQKLLKSNVYQFTLKADSTSYLDVGQIDTSKFSGSLSWVNVSPSDGYWSTDIGINGNDCSGIIDTGTTIIVAGNDKLKNLLSKLDGVIVKQDDDGNYQGWFNCNSPPEIKFSVAGKQFTMPEAIMKYQQSGNECRLPMNGMDGFSDWIFGTPFMEMASVVFDFDNARLGFASQ